MQTSEIYTQELASEVATRVKYFLDHPDDNRYFELTLIRNRKRSGTAPPTEETSVVRLRLLKDSIPAVIKRANGGQFVRCETLEGKKVDVLLPHPHERSIAPARVELED